MENRPPPRVAERAANWPGVQPWGDWTPDHFFTFVREPGREREDATSRVYQPVDDTVGSRLTALRPLSPYAGEPHVLFRCHRIALDFGPEAAERALLYYKRRGKI